MVMSGTTTCDSQAALPYRLDPSTLETIGLETLGGHLRPGVPVDMGSDQLHRGFGAFQRAFHASNAALPLELVSGGGDAVTAHPHIDSNTGRLVMFSYKMRNTGGCGSMLACLLATP